MSIISVEKLTFAYDGSGDNIFDNVSFHIDTDWKLGFVGRNGRGKTTFMKLLMGEYEYKGKIIDDNAYLVEVKLKYKEDLGYHTDYKVTLVKKDKLLEVVSLDEI